MIMVFKIHYNLDIFGVILRHLKTKNLKENIQSQYQMHIATFGPLLDMYLCVGFNVD
jgi:hypothetical protein